MIKCSKCEKEIEGTYEFCPHCGNSLKEEKNIQNEVIEPKKKEKKGINNQEIGNNIKKIIPIVIGIIILIIVIVTIVTKVLKEKQLNETYQHGISLIDNKEWERATTVFNNLGDYKDSKDMLTKIVYLENIEKIENGLKYPSLYESELKSGISKLLSIQDYSDASKKLDEYLKTIKEKIDAEKNVKNSVQKDYSNGIFSYLNALDNYAYNDNYKEDVSKYVCDFTTQAFKEGFMVYDITSRIKYRCSDSSFLNNNKYYKMTSNSWLGTESKGRYASQQYFIQFLTNNVMTYEETYISIYGMVPIKESFWYKVYDNAIYVKTNKKDPYKKKFTISKLTDTQLKFSGTKYTLKKM